MATFSDAVRERSDEGLVALLRARPDLASPSPSTLRSLAARASSRWMAWNSRFDPARCMR